MTGPLLGLLLVSLARAAPDDTVGTELRVSPTALNVRATPALDGELRGLIAKGEPFVVLGRAEGTGCGGDGWGRVLDSTAGDGFACLERTSVTTESPAHLPWLVNFEAPVPADYPTYVKSGDYPRAQRSPSIPYIYGKRWRRWHGQVWDNVDAWVRGLPSADQLDTGHSYSFVGVVDTPRGRAFVRPDGSVVPATEVFLFPVTGFQGRDLSASPPAKGTTPAWVVAYDGARIQAAAGGTDKQAPILPYHAELNVPTEATGRWWEVADALGKGTPGYVAASSIRRWVGAPRPTEIADEENWIDVDLDQQTIAWMQGDKPRYVTLVSTGSAGHETPVGTFRIYDKSTTGDMKSLEGAKDPYHVEEVPWVMHFKPRYALHGAFWHWGFGHTASHGCINLSPIDARYIFDHVTPALPDGFTTIRKGAEPGTLVRIRESGGSRAK
ncbi:MAG: L,D-transpeptidase [Myxococcota bacterium]